MLATTVCLVFILFHDGIKTLSILGTVIESGRDHAKIWYVLIAWLVWSLWRFVHLIDLKKMSCSEEFFQAFERSAISATLNKAKKELAQKFFEDAAKQHGIRLDELRARSPKLSLKASGDPNYEAFAAEADSQQFAEIHELFNEHYRRHINIEGNFQYSITFNNEKGKRRLFGVITEDLEATPWIRLVAKTKATLTVILLSRWFTDQVLPIPFALATLATAIYNLKLSTGMTD